ncbi:MAG: tetratricopeptide repeat protein [bacterium]
MSKTPYSVDSFASQHPAFQESVLSRKRTADRWLAPLCGGLAFVFYWLLTPHGLPPGAPAELTATAMGLPARSPDFHLLWRALAALLSGIPAGTLSVKLALLSAACSAIAASLVYRVSVELMMHQLIPGGTGGDRRKVRAVQIGGVVAALAFATSSPAALAATRASLRAPDVLLVLTTVWLFLRYCKFRRAGTLLLSGVTCGLCMGETPGGCAAFAVMLIGGVILLWRQERSPLPMLAYAGLALGVMLLVYPGLCGLCHVPGGGVRQLLSAHGREFLQEYAATRAGLFLCALSLLPLLFALAAMNHMLNYSEEMNSLMTLSVLAAVSLLVLTRDVALFQASALLSPEPPVLPHLFAALTAGFAAAGWWSMAWSRVPDADPDESDRCHAGTTRMIKGLGYAGALVIAAAVCFSGFLTAGALRARPDGYPQLCAEAMLQDLGARHWLFGRTPVNTHLTVLARDRHFPLQVIPLPPSAGWSAALQQRLNETVAHGQDFAGLDRVLLAGALAQGPEIFLRTWLLIDPQAVGKIAVAGSPLVWSSCGYAPVPARFFFSGSLQPQAPPQAFYSRILQAAQALKRAQAAGAADGAALDVFRNAGQGLSASAAYAAAACRRGGETRAAAGLLAACQSALRTPPGPRGFLATPLSRIWETTILHARSDCADVLHMSRAHEQLDVPANNDAAGDWSARDREQEQVLLCEATAKHPRDLWSWHRLVVSRLQSGESDLVWQELLPAMERAAGDRTNDLVRLTRALVLCARGGPSLQEARDLFADAADANPELVAAREWALRLDLLQSDEAAVIRDAGELLSGDETHAQANYALALVAARRSQIAEADRYFRQSLAGASTPQALSGQARLYCQRGMPREAIPLARKVTAEYPTYPDGWIVLGEALAAVGRSSEAEDVRSRAGALEPRRGSPILGAAQFPAGSTFFAGRIAPARGKRYD